MTWILLSAGLLMALLSGVFLSFSDFVMRGLVQAPGTAGASTTLWAYDAGRLVTRTDPLGNETTYTYDGYDRRITETNQEGHVTRYTYDECGRATSTTWRRRSR